MRRTRCNSSYINRSELFPSGNLSLLTPIIELFRIKPMTMRLSPSFLLLAVHALLSSALSFGGRPDAMVWDIVDKRAPSQDIVTWDEHSLFVRGERVLIFSGEIHPFRLPVPSLWPDVLQKIKALGFNCVSIYIDWALLEGKPGEFKAGGVFNLQPFFDAATKAGIYIIARPGPYINAEVSGGGFPGWLQRVRGTLRTGAPDYLNATENYMSNICSIIAAAQITNGGPVILVQPENEYTAAHDYLPFPDAAYMQYVIDQARKAGIVVPFISNDASALGHNAPGTGEGEVDIYGHDGYPLGFDCAHPHVWPTDGLPTTLRSSHLKQSPSTPFSLVEFQGGSFDPWGGWGFEQCSALVNHEFERVFYKNNYAAGVTIQNLYMIFGGTNWGNLGHPGGYTSYDYGSVIKEDRTVTREKYSELKLQTTFLQSSPDYITASPGQSSTSSYSDSPDITVTPIFGNSTENASFFVVRHTNYSSLTTTKYRAILPTSQGEKTVPQLNATLSLNGRDSKIMVTNYDVQGTRLLYSTAEIFTHIKQGDNTILVLYAETNEYNEFVVQTSGGQVKQIRGGASYTVKNEDSTGNTLVGWVAESKDAIFLISDHFYAYLLDRNSAYNYWLTPVDNSTSKVIITGPYLVRSSYVDANGLHIKADFNATTKVEVIGAPAGVRKLFINGNTMVTEVSGLSLIANVTITLPSFTIPTLSELTWKYTDSLPEIGEGFDDSRWTVADHSFTDNTYQPLLATGSTYASDYGYHTGVLVYRGHFNASGDETSFSLWTQGGLGFGSSIWIDSLWVSSFLGSGSAADYQGKYNVSDFNPEPGTPHVITVVVDNTGLDENYDPGYDTMKAPRGILGWRLETSKATNTPITWKLTGNFGGEDYMDAVRGPLNEGGLHAERQGYHLPGTPTETWVSQTPFDGLEGAGVAFYATAFNLRLPSDQWDIPLSFAFTNDTAAAGGAYRVQLFVNGWQFGKLTSNIGPQTVFPVPEGILNYEGGNYIGLTLWALEAGGAKIPGLELVAGTPVWTSRDAVKFIDNPQWVEREGVY
ncbi:glycoside hydrolase family 35 protein [Hypoxylon sp. FL1150]|nr:glycoside hydrolase family 35 protein [Hypoxylon sp. FL1150]